MENQKDQRLIAIGKPQVIRLVDVFFIGPLMIYMALQGRYKMPGILRLAFFTTGTMTVIYNGRNYIIQRRILKELKEAPPAGKSLNTYARFED